MNDDAITKISERIIKPKYFSLLDYSCVSHAFTKSDKIIFNASITFKWNDFLFPNPIHLLKWILLNLKKAKGIIKIVNWDDNKEFDDLTIYNYVIQFQIDDFKQFMNYLNLSDKNLYKYEEKDFSKIFLNYLKSIL